MRVKYCVPKNIPEGTDQKFLYQDPITKICHWFRTPFSMINNQAPNFVRELHTKMVQEWGEPLDLFDCGEWDNTPDADGRIPHPFDKHRFLNVETDLQS